MHGVFGLWSPNRGIDALACGSVAVGGWVWSVSLTFGVAYKVFQLVAWWCNP